MSEVSAGARVALDTNVLIELLRGKNPLVRQAFNAALATDRRLTTSLLVVHELFFGCERSSDVAREHKRVRLLLGWLTVEPFDEADMIAAARLRADLRRRGETIGPYDVLIGAQALARGWTLITANTREFLRIDGLNVVDWSAAAG